jgi:hypothetical protein
MKITIEIECDDYTDLMNHLSVIRMQIRAALKDKPVDHSETVEDSNCYGNHIIKINQKEKP